MVTMWANQLESPPASDGPIACDLNKESGKWKHRWYYYVLKDEGGSYPTIPMITAFKVIAIQNREFMIG